MNPVFGSRKRADEFDLLLSRTSSGTLETHDATSERYGDLLELVASLRATPAPLPRADFASDLRSRLMVAAESALAPDTSQQSSARRAPATRRSARERRLVAAVGGFAIVSATASMAVAAQSALPGDTLYPLKRAIENAQAGVQRDADGKGTTLLDNAAGRLDEVGALSRSGDDDSTAIATTLEDFVKQASEASDLLLSDYASTGHASSIEELRSFTADSMGALTILQSVIPKDARASLIEATQVINAIDVQAQSLCPACTDLPIIQSPVFAQKTIPTLLDDALSPVVAIDPPSVKAPTNQPSGKSGSGAGKPTGGSTSPDEVSPPDQPTVPDETPNQPSLPQGPKGSDDTGKNDGGKHGAGGLIEDLNVSNSDDPIGDLLTGAGDVVDDVIEGVVDGVGGLGGN
ncbi:hypothetical protein BH09ACT12_BH09ACT12_18930 [soil metagenome]